MTGVDMDSPAWAALEPAQRQRAVAIEVARHALVGSATLPATFDNLMGLADFIITNGTQSDDGTAELESASELYDQVAGLQQQIQGHLATITRQASEIERLVRTGESVDRQIEVIKTHYQRRTDTLTARIARLANEMDAVLQFVPVELRDANRPGSITALAYIESLRSRIAQLEQQQRDRGVTMFDDYSGHVAKPGIDSAYLDIDWSQAEDVARPDGRRLVTEATGAKWLEVAPFTARFERVEPLPAPPTEGDGSWCTALVGSASGMDVACGHEMPCPEHTAVATCTECDLDFTHLDAYDQHAVDVHEPPADQRPLPGWRCSVGHPGEDFATIEAFASHRWAAHLRCPVIIEGRVCDRKMPCPGHTEPAPPAEISEHVGDDGDKPWGSCHYCKGPMPCERHPITVHLDGNDRVTAVTLDAPDGTCEVCGAPPGMAHDMVPHAPDGRPLHAN